MQSFRSALPRYIKGVHMGDDVRSAVSERVCPLSYSAAGGAGVAVVRMKHWWYMVLLATVIQRLRHGAVRSVSGRTPS